MSGARSRVQRILLVFQGTTAVAQVVPALALGALFDGALHAIAAVGVWVLVALRLQTLGRDRRRPWWLTRLIDEPIFAHWGACLIATLALPAAALLRAVGVVSAPWSLMAAWLYAGGLAIAAWSVWPRRRLVRRTVVEIALPNLPEAFDGYRIAHLSDLHIGSYDRIARGRAWVRITRELKPDLVAVTGDLVTMGVAFYPDAAEVLGGLDAPDGVFVSLGNHDQWDAAALTRAITAKGPVVLHNDARVVKRGGGELMVAGLGDRYAGTDDLPRTLRDVRPGVPTVLLSHYPTFFERAADLGADVVLSGHTHGGQFGVPPFSARLNFATLTGQHARGLYRAGSRYLYVSAGLGTTGPPMRLGVAPEVTLIVLRREKVERRGAPP